VGKDEGKGVGSIVGSRDMVGNEVGLKVSVGAGDGTEVGTGVGAHVYTDENTSQHGVPKWFPCSTCTFHALLNISDTSAGTFAQNSLLFTRKLSEKFLIMAN
jgi:hypothetical protein